MTLISYLKGLRRRWAVIVAAVIIALAVGWTSSAVAERSTLPDASAPTIASAIILNTSAPGQGLDTGITNISTLAALTTVGQVPELVAKELESSEDPLVLAGKVQAEADTTTGLLTITANGSSPKEASMLANTFADQLIAYAESENEKGTKLKVDAAEKDVTNLEKEIAEIDEKIGAAGETEAATLREERNAKSTQLSLAEQTLSGLESASASAVPFTIIQRASSAPAATAIPVFRGPTDRMTRLAIAGALGLFLGIAIALVLERFDTRIRNKIQAEHHVGLPVLAEIPMVPRGKAAGVVVSTAPESVTANAFRLLAAGIRHGDHAPTDLDNREILRSVPATTAGGSGPEPIRAPHEAMLSGDDEPRSDGIIMVTSPGRHDGRSTIVANLAASYSEMGMRVVLLSCDFRNPGMHAVLGISDAPGLTDYLQSTNGQVLKSPLKPAQSKDLGFTVVPSGGPPSRPTELLGSEKMQSTIAEARRAYDVVLIDTPPVLSSSDATLLLGQVDKVLGVVRAGKTTEDHAQRSSELLNRLDAPVIGVVLNAVTDSTLAGYSWLSRRRGFPPLARHQKGA